MFLFLFLTQIFANNIVQSPANCLNNKVDSCSIMANENTNLKLANANLYLKANSVIAINEEKIQFYKGRIFIKGQANLESVFAEFQCKSEGCQLDLTLFDDHIKVKNLEGLVYYKKTGEEEWSKYPRYFTNKIKAVSPLDGKAHESIFTVLDLKDYKNTYSLDSELQNILKEKESYYSTVLRDQRFISSQIIKTSVVEEQKNKRKKQEQKEQKLRALQKQKEENRKMYFERNFFE